MSRTRRKLEEAGFFLGELERTYYEHVESLKWLSQTNSEVPVCQYYLSAFVSSARSVMWIMRSEYQNVIGWEDWYRSKKPNSAGEEFLRKINAVRVRSEKQDPLRLAYNIAFKEVSNEATQNTIDELIPEWYHKRYNLKFEPVLEEGEELDEKAQKFELKAEVTSFFWSIEEFPKEDVLKICNSYFVLLENMVEECEACFSQY